MQFVGASMMGAGIGGIAGGYIGEALGFDFETGAMIGGMIGSIAGGKVYNNIRFSNIAKQGIVIGKGDTFKDFAKTSGHAYYKGMTGYEAIKSISPRIATRLGWANNYHYIKSVMRYRQNL